MRQSLGKRLSNARVERGLTIDEVAHTTRMRPDKIIALENDDYSRFGSNAYAKGFLLIYSRLLKVDATEELHNLDTPTELRVHDYQYLANAAHPAPDQRSPRTTRTARTPRPAPSLAPLFGFVFLTLIAGAVFYVIVLNNRIRNTDQSHESTPAPQSPWASGTQDKPDTHPTPAATPQPTPQNLSQLPHIEPIAAGPDTLPRLRPSSEIAIAAKKKTWVTIYRNDPNSTPIFVDFLYPNSPPLKRRGERLFIVAREPDSLEIRKNGELVAYVPGSALQ